MDSESRELMSEQIADDILEELTRRLQEIRALDPMTKKIIREILRYRAEKCIEKFFESGGSEERDRGDEEETEELL